MIIVSPTIALVSDMDERLTAKGIPVARYGGRVDPTLLIMYGTGKGIGESFFFSVRFHFGTRLL